MLSRPKIKKRGERGELEGVQLNLGKWHGQCEYSLAHCVDSMLGRPL
jgi:hypothetical protein